MEMDSKYHLGDEVQIGCVRSCVFGWNEDMESYSGKTGTIQKVHWSKYKNAYSYEIDLDNRYWMWDDSCFESTVQDLPEFTTDTAGLPSLFS